MSERMYKHMKNTLNDVDIILKDKSMSDEEKVKNIRLEIGLLKDVECGEEIIDKLAGISDALDRFCMFRKDDVLSLYNVFAKLCDYIECGVGCGNCPMWSDICGQPNSYQCDDFAESLKRVRDVLGIGVE